MKQDMTERLHSEYYRCEKCGHKMKSPEWDGSCPKCGATEKYVHEYFTWQETLDDKERAP